MALEATDLLSDDPAVLGFDPAALKERYARERDRRQKSDGAAQYARLEQRRPDADADPYMPIVPRAPRSETVNVAIVGGGFGGLLAAAYLRKANIDEFRIIEAGGDFGGTWYWNRYPNAQCDTEAYLYLPLLEDCAYMPTRNYAYAPEIFEHARRIGRTFDLYPSALFHTEIVSATWNEEDAAWLVLTNRGDQIRAHHLILANGGLMRPKLPNVPGIEEFRGHMFHTSRWDYDYTGGADDGRLVNLADKKVGIVGTGATAIQCVPPLAEASEELFVFQRTPSSVGVRGNRLTDPDWAAGLSPGWQRQRSERFVAAVEGAEVDPSEFPGDGWIDLIAANAKAVRALHAAGYDLTSADKARVTENADYEKMEQVRDRITSIVRDPQTAELLKPWYRPLCKRPCFHDEYLDTFNRPNVRLVDAGDGGIERVTETGIVVGGKSYDLDCLIFATGFETTPTFAEKSGFQVTGREGLSLGGKWRDGFLTMFGVTAAGFPNCYFMTRTQAPLPQNIPTLLEESAEHIAYLISQVKARGIRTLDTTLEGEQAWQDEMTARRKGMMRFYSQCTPGYFNNEGQISDKGHSFFAGLYGGGTIGFFDLLRGWRRRNALEGMVFDSSADAGNSRLEAAR